MRSLALGSLCALISMGAFASGTHPPAGYSNQEALLLEALASFQHGDVNQALRQVNALVRTEPNFRLAHLLRGDILASQAGSPLSLDDDFGFSRQGVDDLLAEARQRLKRKKFNLSGRVPAAVLQLAPSQKHAVVVDTAASRLYLFENKQGRPELISDYYVSAGKNGTRKQVEGDRRTPLGVYFVTSRLPGTTLPDKYGPVAFPVDYPNYWDQRVGRTGDGIWLHGVSSSTYSRPPQDSDGCVAMSNTDLDRVAPLLSAGKTPVVIAEGLDWLDADTVSDRREQVAQSIEQWRSAWESGDTDAYLSYYADDFVGRGMDRQRWGEYKRQVNQAKRFITVEVADMSLFSYPDEPDLVLARFRQTYDSNNVQRRATKHQYWRLADNGSWKITTEEVE